jgi:hypothetical protein
MLMLAGLARCNMNENINAIHKRLDEIEDCQQE